MNKAIFFDRDGVINRSIIKNNKPYPPKNLEELELIDGIHLLMWRLKQKGFLIFVITNQPDVSRGTQTKSMVEALNTNIKKELPINEIFTCYHDDKNNCECRKPKSGFILQAKDKYDIDLKQSFVIGDRWKDIQAGKSAGCLTIFIDYGYDEELKCKPDYKVKNIKEIEGVIL